MEVDPKLKVSDLYRSHPEVLPVLERYRIDLCCGGERSLEEVARKHGLDLALLLREFSEALKAA